MKIVINSCFGGFGLSDEAFEKLISMGMKVTRYTSRGNCEDSTADIVDMNDPSLLKEAGKGTFGRRYTFVGDYSGNGLRTDPRVIQVVEELGAKADGMCAKLKIVEVPDGIDWSIEEYDGNEHVSENHRTWS